MGLTVLPAASGRELRRFVDVPWQLFDARRHPQWVPPLRMAVRDVLAPAHPFWRAADRALFVAERDGRVVGRVAAIENRAHTAHRGDRTGFFGFFECADDPAAARALLDAARAWLAPRGLDRLEGPVSPSTNYECGVLVDGHEHHPVLMTAWNPPYYDALLRGAGLAPAKDLLGWWLQRDTPEGEFRLPAAYAAHAERARARQDVTFRDLEPARMRQEVELCWEVYNAAWEHNWGYVPMSRAEFEHLGRDLARIADPRFCFAAEIGGAPAGIALALPDYNALLKRIPSGRLLPTGIFTLLAGRRSLRTLRVLALGVKQEHRTAGIFALFVHEMIRRWLAAGMSGLESSWVLEDNHRMNRPLAAMGAAPYRRWRLYEGGTAGAAA